MLKRRKDPEIVQVDLKFDETLTNFQGLHVIEELFKCFIFQRRQIPLTIESLKKEIRQYHSEKVAQKPDESLPKTREEIKAKKLRVRKDKLRQKLVQRAEKFITNFNQIEACLEKNLAQVQATHVAVIFGVSPQNPKEVYVMNLPRNLVKSKMSLEKSRTLNHRKMLSVFRILMQNDDLFTRVSQEMPLTNIHLGLKIQHCQHLEQFKAFPNFQNWPSSVKLTQFHILHQNPTDHEHGDFVMVEESYTPSAMDLCTPIVQRTCRKRSHSGQSFSCSDDHGEDLMLETPCQKTTWLETIEEDFSMLSVAEQSCEVNQDNDDGIWHFCDLPLKGFRDPHLS